MSTLKSPSAWVTSGDVVHVHVLISRDYIIWYYPCSLSHQHGLHHQMSMFMSSSAWITSSDIVHIHVLISTENTNMSMSSSALITSSDVVHIHVLIRTQVGDADKRAARGGSLGIRFSGTGPWKYKQSCQPHTSDLATTPCILRQVQVNF